MVNELRFCYTRERPGERRQPHLEGSKPGQGARHPRAATAWSGRANITITGFTAITDVGELRRTTRHSSS